MKQILIVDDNKCNCDLLVEIFGTRAKTTVAYNGEDALRKHEKALDAKKGMDLILLDIAMPGMDGIAVLRHIREKEQALGIKLGQGVPIIMVTAYKEPFLDAFSGGCDDYVLKPIMAEELIKKVEEKIGPL